MKNFLSFFLLISLFCLGFEAVSAQETNNLVSQNNVSTETKPNTEANVTKNDSLVKLLIKKGVISNEEANELGNISPEQRKNLASLLVKKGIISNSELDELQISESKPNLTQNNLANADIPKVSPASVEKNEAKPVGNSSNFASSVKPIRVFDFNADENKRLIPDIKLGSGVKLNLYGFFKASAVYNTSNPTGNDFPLPGFMQDSSSSGLPSFHLKARSLRLGANFQWANIFKDSILSGKIEIDFEGDFSRANNRVNSAISSNQPVLRLAWARLDKNFNDRLSSYFLVGQDWTPFGSSTMPDTLETTAIHAGFGNIYGRSPQFRLGFNYLLDKKNKVRFMPEIALVMPISGNVPTGYDLNQLPTTDPTNIIALGEREGPYSAQPEVQGRGVLQFQLDKAEDVAPAQLIASFMVGRRKAYHNQIDFVSSFRGYFPYGIELESKKYGYTAEFQLPTRWFTLIGKYYNGRDLRAYGGGQFFSVYNDTTGLTNLTYFTSEDSSSYFVVGLKNGVPTVAPQNGVRASGGFVNLGMPISRWLKAKPDSYLNGISAYLHYGYDSANPNDVKFIINGNNPYILDASRSTRVLSRVYMSNFKYELNKYVSFGFEQSYFQTFAGTYTTAFPRFRGIPARQTHNLRSEFATIFKF